MDKEKSKERKNTELEELNTVDKDVPSKSHSISFFKIQFHLATNTDILLMVIATISSLGSGLGNPILSLCFGETVSILGDSMTFQTDQMTPQERIAFFDDFEDSVYTMVIRFLYIAVVSFVVFAVGHALWNYIGLKQMHTLKQRYFTLILSKEQKWFDKQNTFEFATKITSELETIEKGIGENTGNCLHYGSQFISGLGVAMFSSWRLTLLMLTVSPIILICMFSLVSAYTDAYIKTTAAYDQAGGIAEEILYNIKTVASFANFDYEIKRFDTQIAEVKRINYRKAIKVGLLIATATFFNYATLTICASYAQRMIRHREWNHATDDYFKGGDITAVNWATMHAIFSITYIVPNIKAIKEACIAACSYFDLLDISSNENQSKKNCLFPSRKDIKGKIEFKDVSFSYSENKKVLDRISFCFEPGKKYAIVGDSGCGKSTVVNVIERLYEINEGNIYLDDVDITKLDIHFYRSLIGYVQQEPVLFNMSIKDNIIFGREDIIKEVAKLEGKSDEELLKEAVEDSYSDEFINTFKEKLEYEVGVKGSKLSGGQKQRIAIARGIIAKPKILILDEATSALDYKSEKEVQKALDLINEKCNITTIIIAHRLSTIKNANRIYCMKEGKIIESGTHEELIRNANGYYSQMLKNQLEEEKEKNKANKNKKEDDSKSNESEKEDKDNKVQSQSKEEEVNKEEMKGSLLGQICSLLSDHKLDTIISIASAFCSGLMNPLLGYSLAKCVNALTSSDMSKVKDDGVLYALLYLLFAFLNGIFSFLRLWKIDVIGSILTYKMRKELINKYIHTDLSFHDNKSNSPGSLLTKLSIDTVQLTSIINGIFGDFINTLGCTILGVILGLVYDWKIALITVVGMILITVSDFLSIRTRPYGRPSYIKANVEAGSVLSESVSNTKTIFTYNFQEKAVQLYMKILHVVKKDFIRDSILKGVFKGLKFFFYFFNDVYIFYAAGQFIIKDKLTFENMNLSVTCVMVANSGIVNSLEGFADYKKAKVAFVNLFKVLGIKDKVDSTDTYNRTKKEVTNLQGKIEFRNVSFHYPTKTDKKILNNISFTIEPGQKVALVGHSGSGKSTIIQLLERFYEIEQGEILIDDINIKEYHLLQLRKKIGLVSQEPSIFKRNVIDNINYGDLIKNKEEVINAARKAKVDHLIDIQEIKDKDSKVSGGEKQRIAIARVILKNPSIILLDEATSALDRESEKQVEESLKSLIKGRTSISIAHRLDTIIDSDVIFVMEDGRIVEQGVHQELLDKKGKYYSLYHSQN